MQQFSDEDELIELSPGALPETAAAFEAKEPWIGIFVKEQVERQMAAGGQDVPPGLKNLVADMMTRIAPAVEQVCSTAVVDGVMLYGPHTGTINDSVFVILTQMTSVVVSMDGHFEYRQNRPEEAIGASIWSVMIDLVDTQERLDLIPMLLAWRLGEEGTIRANRTIDAIKKTGYTPCFVIFLGKHESKIGGLLTVANLPATFHAQLALTGTPAGNA